MKFTCALRNFCSTCLFSFVPPVLLAAGSKSLWCSFFKLIFSVLLLFISLPLDLFVVLLSSCLESRVHLQFGQMITELIFSAVLSFFTKAWDMVSVALNLELTRGRCFSGCFVNRFPSISNLKESFFSHRFFDCVVFVLCGKISCLVWVMELQYCLYLDWRWTGYQSWPDIRPC